MLILIALTALSFSDEALTDDFAPRFPGHIAVQADRNNDGVLSAGEVARAERLLEFRTFGGDK